jgi:hypothetical protein
LSEYLQEEEPLFPIADPVDLVQKIPELAVVLPDEGVYEWVDHPKHYNTHPSGVECIDIVRHYGFNIGTVIKHLWRAGLKPGQDTIRDLKKAAWYLNDEIARIEGRSE